MPTLYAEFDWIVKQTDETVYGTHFCDENLKPLLAVVRCPSCIKYHCGICKEQSPEKVTDILNMNQAARDIYCEECFMKKIKPLAAKRRAAHQVLDEIDQEISELKKLRPESLAAEDEIKKLTAEMLHREAAKQLQAMSLTGNGQPETIVKTCPQPDGGLIEETWRGNKLMHRTYRKP